MSIGIFISGRLSSERLPGKLLLPIGNSSLWEIACEKLNQLPDKYNKYVLAEDGELFTIAQKYENLNVIRRSPETTNIDGPLAEIFKDLRNVLDDYLMFLNPCLSYLTIETILNALESFEHSQKDYATSVKCIKNWLFDTNKESINPIDYEHLSTKDVEPLWQAAHCFHIFPCKQFFIDGKMLSSNLELLVVAEDETLDVDTLSDYEFVRWKHEVCN